MLLKNSFRVAALILFATLTLVAAQEEFCDPNNRPTICYDIYASVCAYSLECVDIFCAQTFSNDCIACTNSEVAYYFPGECRKVNSGQGQPIIEEGGAITEEWANEEEWLLEEEMEIEIEQEFTVIPLPQIGFD